MTTNGRTRVSEADLVAHYNANGQNVSATAGHFKLSYTAVFLRLRKLGKYVAFDRGRLTRAFTDDELKKQFTADKGDMSALAKKYNVAEGTVRKHCVRLGLVPKGRKLSSPEALVREAGIYDSYIGTVTIIDLASKFKIGIGAVKNSLRREVGRREAALKAHALPVPKSIEQIKLHNTLAKNGKVIGDDAEKLASATLVSLAECKGYMQRVIEKRGKTAAKK